MQVSGALEIAVESAQHSHLVVVVQLFVRQFQPTSQGDPCLFDASPTKQQRQTQRSLQFQLQVRPATADKSSQSDGRPMNALAQERQVEQERARCCSQSGKQLRFLAPSV